MNVVAYCDARYERATRLAAGTAATVAVSPPVTDRGWRSPEARRLLERADLIYFNFHALPGMDAWVNTAGDTALSAETLAGLDLGRGVVFMVNCYAGGGMLAALKACRPRAIIGGEGENFGGVGLMAGADRLGAWLRRGLALGLPPPAALALAKVRLRLGAQTASVRDALAFRVM